MVLKASEVSDLKYGTLYHTTLNLPKNWKPLKKLLIIGIACLVTALFVVWKIFYKNLLDVYYSSGFLFNVTFSYIYIYIYIYIYNISPLV